MSNAKRVCGENTQMNQLFPYTADKVCAKMAVMMLTDCYLFIHCIENPNYQYYESGKLIQVKLFERKCNFYVFQNK